MEFRRLSIARTVIAGAALSMAVVSAQAGYQTLYSFTGIGSNGGNEPSGPLIAGENGVLYGVTRSGGIASKNFPDGCGTVFSLTPPAAGQTAWKHAVLHAFEPTGPAGQLPFGNLYRDRHGALFGTTATGGISGSAYKLTPPAPGRSKWTFEVIHKFANGADDAAFPVAGMIADKNGALYGTSTGGGPDFDGTVFRLTPPTGSGRWTSKVLITFNDQRGLGPQGGLVADSDGNLYGATAGRSAHGGGNVFRLSPPASGDGKWKFTPLHQFSGGSDGSAALRTLLLRKGVLYGATTGGGIGNGGTLFAVTLPASPSGKPGYQVLHRFLPAEGSNLLTELTAGSGGVLYGIARNGGSSKLGTLFRASPPAAANADWTVEVLHAFTGMPDGASPQNGVVRDKSGTLFGVTTIGGKHNLGTVFSYSP